MTGSTGDAPAPPAPTGERFEPYHMHGQLIEAEHLARYAWACRFAAGRRVLDAACGTGYGTAMLAAAGAREVVGVDLDEEEVARARSGARPGTRFDVGDLRSLPYEDGEFDLVVSFESIEHVPDPEAVLDEFARVLGPEGMLVLSTPNRDVYTPGNPFHLRELTPGELEAELLQRFESAALYRQHSWAASGVFDDAAFESADYEPIEAVEVRKAWRDEPGLETFTIGIAANGELPKGTRLVSLTADLDLRDWKERLDAADLALATAPAGEASAAADAVLLREELAQLREQLARSEAELARFAGIEAKLEAASAALAEYDNVLAQHREVLGSTSWRFTRWFRRLSAMVRGSRS